MALLESIQRSVDRLGLVPKIVRSLRMLSIILIMSGMIWVFVLPLQGQYRGTYISENALMPSQAYSFFRESEWNFVRGYREEVLELTRNNKTLQEKNEVVESWLADIGYKTSEHVYQELYTNETKSVKYAIYHVPRGDDTESMVLTAPWKTASGEDNIGGISLALGLAKYFYRLSIWSKNIIVVIPENGQDALKSWVDSYHTTLDQTGGSIESAVLLDFASENDYLDYIELGYAGVNGQLPNLDLINCAVSISEHEGFKVSLHNTPKGQLWTNDYFSRITTVLKGLFEMSTAGLIKFQSDGNGCEAFGAWNIQAISIKAVGDAGHDITTLGRVIEAIFRAVNNLLEKWHQSFFFYLLLAPRSFVSIGNYLPSAVLTCASLAAASLSALLTNNNLNNANVTFEFKQCFLSTVSIIKGFSILSAIITFCLVIGFSLDHFTRTCSFEQYYDTYYNITYGFIIPPILLSLIPIILPKSKPKSSFTYQDKQKTEVIRLLNSSSIFYLTVILIALLVVHYSLAFSICILCFPSVLVKYGSRSKVSTLQKLKNSLLLIISFPGTWVLVIGFFKKFEFDLDVLRNLFQYFRLELVLDIVDKIKSIDYIGDKDNILQGPVEVIYGLFSSYARFQSCTWLIVVLGWLPLWLATLIITFIDVEIQDGYDVIEDDKKNN